jgi:hypothetical protein
MRSITVLVIACCVLAATCFPKHHVDKKASKLVHDAENDLDEVSDVQENNQEEASENDEPALESDDENKDDEPALEDDDDDNKAEKESDNEVAEATQVLEESDAADVEEPKEELEESGNEEHLQESGNEENLEESDKDSDNDESAKLEEEEEERDTAQKSVVSDIENLQQALEESDLTPKARQAASDNLNKIQDDVIEMRGASAARRESLKQAVHKRMEAFKMQINQDTRQQELEEEEEAVTRVKGDVSQLEEAIESSSMSSADKHRAEKNLKAISRDAEEYAESTNAKAKSLFREAIGKRMQALHLMLEAEPVAEEKPVISASAVIEDIHHIQAELKTAHMPNHAKKAVRENLKTMLKDAEEISTASEARRGRLEEALKLRSKALRQQLEEY